MRSAGGYEMNIEKGYYRHKNLGIVEITDECLFLQEKNSDPTSVYVMKDNDIREVSLNCLKPCMRLTN